MHPFLEHPSPIVFAHRGCHESGPENTFDAFQGAFDKGVRYMETDVHLTLDGHLVAFHDRSLLRMTGAPRLIRDLTLADVVATPLTHGARIPTLLELLEAFPNAKFNIDLKAMKRSSPSLNSPKQILFSIGSAWVLFLTRGPTQQNLPCPAFAPR